jgi:5-methylcytosine-specific restriction endonuclease McrA
VITTSGKSRANDKLEGNTGDFNRLRETRGDIKSLSDGKLLSRLDRINRKERKLELAVLFYLREVERRGLHLSLGYSSLFEFCTGRLKYSRSSAYRRVAAARVIEKYPVFAGMLLEGRTNLSVVAMISKVINNRNCGHIISIIDGRSYREAERLLSVYRPVPRRRDRVKIVSVFEEDRGAGSVSGAESLLGSDSGGVETRAGCGVGTGSRSFGEIRHDNNKTGSDVGSDCNGEENSLSEKKLILKNKYELKFMVDPGFMEMYNKIRSLLSNKYPQGITFEMLFEIVMQEYLERHDPRRRLARRKEREKGRDKKLDNKHNKKSDDKLNENCNKKYKDECNKSRSRSQNDNGRNAKSRHIPKAIRDQVYARDGGRCTFVGKDGRRCNCRWELEIDHIIPFARGGDKSPENLRLLCRRHNMIEAERVYGKELMNKYYQRE